MGSKCMERTIHVYVEQYGTVQKYLQPNRIEMNIKFYWTDEH